MEFNDIPDPESTVVEESNLGPYHEKINNVHYETQIRIRKYKVPFYIRFFGRHHIQTDGDTDIYGYKYRGEFNVYMKISVERVRK